MPGQSLPVNINDTGTSSVTVANFSGATVTNPTLAFSSNNPSIATIDASGNWTAVASGGVTFTVNATDPSNGDTGSDTATLQVAAGDTGVLTVALTLTKNG